MCLVIPLLLVSELCVRQVSGLVFLLSSEESWDILPKISQQSIGRSFIYFFSSIDINTLTCLWSKLPSTHVIGTHCPAFCFSGDLSKAGKSLSSPIFLLFLFGDCGSSLSLLNDWKPFEGRENGLLTCVVWGQQMGSGFGAGVCIWAVQCSDFIYWFVKWNKLMLIFSGCRDS